MPVIRGLVAEAILQTTAEYRNGFSKLLPATDVQHFAEYYEATSVLARRFHLNSRSLAYYLKELGTPLLAIPIPDSGKGHAFFLHKDVAAQIQLPSRRMLREQAQRRIEAAHKKKWEEYRAGREPPWVSPCDEPGRIVVAAPEMARNEVLSWKTGTLRVSFR